MEREHWWAGTDLAAMDELVFQVSELSNGLVTRQLTVRIKRARQEKWGNYSPH